MRNYRRKDGINGDSTLADVNEQELAKDIARDNNDSFKNGQIRENNGLLPIEKEEQALVCAESAEKHKKKPEGKSGTNEKKRGRGTDAVSAICVCVIILCVLVALATVLIALSSRPSDDIQEPDDLLSEPTDDVGSGVVDTVRPMPAASEVYERIADSAVTLAVYTPEGVRYCSGTVVFSDGYIVTLAEALVGVTRISATLRDGRCFEAKILGTEPTSGLCLLRVEADELCAVSVAAADSVEAGDKIYAVGTLTASKNTVLSSSLCTGVVSYGTRTISLGDRRVRAMQLSAFASDTLRGCPVFNGYGDAVGLMLSSGEGSSASFALALDAAMEVLSELKNGDAPSSESVGALAYAYPKLCIACEDTENGVRVVSFFDAHSDAAIKLREGDVIVGVGDTAITDTAALRGAISERRAGERVEIFVIRAQQRLSFFVELQQ